MGVDTPGVAVDKQEEADTPVVVDRRVEEEPDKQAAVDKPGEGAAIAEKEPLPLSPQYHRLHKNGHCLPDYGRNRCKIETSFTSLSGFIRAAIMAYRKDRFNGCLTQHEDKFVLRHPNIPRELNTWSRRNNFFRLLAL